MEIRLSSKKSGFNLEDLFSDNKELYWSSEGPLPHFICIYFDEIEYVHHIQLYLTFLNDQTYTPENIDIYIGLTNRKVDFFETKKFFEPEGVMPIPIKQEVKVIYLVVRKNHQDGKDSHIRQLRVMRNQTLQFYQKPTYKN